jgi:hypothetical protein
MEETGRAEGRVSVLFWHIVPDLFRSRRVDISFEGQASQPPLRTLRRSTLGNILGDFGKAIGEAEIMWLAQLWFERPASSSQRCCELNPRERLCLRGRSGKLFVFNSGKLSGSQQSR